MSTKFKFFVNQFLFTILDFEVIFGEVVVVVPLKIILRISNKFR